MILKSRIKAAINDETLRYIAAVCDTMRFHSAQHKMIIIQQLLKKQGVEFVVNGGATNRVVVTIDGYIFKFAVDRQGYVDNLVEYSICRELQPYVVKAYETNGYILVAEGVKTMSLDEFKLRRSDIERVLSTLAQDYLLGDVGFTKKNFENWGVRDDGSVVILDYAYIHRGTEELFTCEVCGCGILHYDSTFTYLKCSNAADCGAQFQYIDRKRIQGDQVDLDMIAEAKDYSIKMKPKVYVKEVIDNDGLLSTGNKRVTNSLAEYIKYVEETKNMINPEYGHDEDVMDLLVEKAQAKTEAERDEIQKKIDDLYNSYHEDTSDDADELTYVPSEEESDTEDEEYSVDKCDLDYAASLDDLIDMASSHTATMVSDDAQSDDTVNLDTNVEVNTESDSAEDNSQSDQSEDANDSVNADHEQTSYDKSESSDSEPDSNESVKDQTDAASIAKAIQDSIKTGSEDDSQTGVYLNGERIDGK